VREFILFGLSIILALPLILACTDYFTEDKNITICNYCQELNGSPCSPSVSCSYTVYSVNNFENVLFEAPALNYGNGTITYNITQGNLSRGEYIGELICNKTNENKFRASFSFTIQETPTKLSASYSGGRGLQGEERIVEKDEKHFLALYNEFNDALDYYGEKLWPSKKSLGKFILILILIFAIFNVSIITFIKKIKNKIKLRK